MTGASPTFEQSGAVVTLPEDVATALGSDATLTVGPDNVVTLRPLNGPTRKLTVDEVLALTGARPVEDPNTIMHATTPLTGEERVALGAFLSEG